MNTYEPPVVETESDTRQHLTAHVARFRAEGAMAQPVIFGDRRRPEAVLLSYEIYEQLIELLDDLVTEQRVRERLANDTGERFTLDEVAPELGIDLSKL